MSFNRTEVDNLLVECHRRCCICHRFCGVKMETDHILQPYEEGGSDNIDNAIPVCFECHAEIHSYNDKHPRGRKFTPNELRKHKEQWLTICREQPEVLIKTYVRSDVGPLQALVDELEFNKRVAGLPNTNVIGCLFRDHQFTRAIQLGSIATLVDELKESIICAYVSMGKANLHISAALSHAHRRNKATDLNNAQDAIRSAEPNIQNAFDELLKFLSTG